MSVLNNKLIRDFKKNTGQIIAVLMVIIVGISVFTAFLSCYYNLVLSKNYYYSKYRFHDFSILLEKAPKSALFKLSEIEGVKKVRGRIVKDVSLDTENSKDNKIARLISIPEKFDNIIDGIHISEGRIFSESSINECVVNNQFFKSNNLKIGDKINITANGKKLSLRITGSALSPEYVYPIRNAQEMFPNPEKFAIIWVNEKLLSTIFNLNDFYNEIIGEIYPNAEINKILDKADKLLKSYIIYSKIERKNQISNWYLSSEIDGLEVSSKITPAIFLLISSVILLIMLTRMVKRERTQIGLMKAYGYSNFMISMYYIKFSSIIGLSGGILGFLLGQWMGYGLMSIYVQFYSFPVTDYKSYPSLFFYSIIISLGASLISALFAVSLAVKIMPAEAMKEKAPLSSSKIFLERWKNLWKRFSFTNKIIIRNISRYPLRAIFTIFGVQVSTGIIIIGYFAQDAMSYMLEHQFNIVQKEDVKVSFYRERSMKAWYESKRFPQVIKSEPILVYPFEIKHKWRKKDMIITGIQQNISMLNLLDTNNKKINIEDCGIILLDIVASELGIKEGDTIIIKALDGKNQKKQYIKVNKIVTMYIGTGAYMSIDSLSRLLNYPTVLNSVLLKVDNNKNIDELNSYLKNTPLISTVERKNEVLENFYKSVGNSMAISNFFLILFSGIIAIAVIYNSTIINIIEREREIASLKVLGFTDKEVSKIIFNENFFLSFLGIILGIPFGYWLCKLMVKAYETELFRFPFYISNLTYIISTLLIMFFVFITNIILRKKITKIDMVSALKARE